MTNDMPNDMPNDMAEEVNSRLWDHHFEELSGKVTPPDRTHEILRRIATRAEANPPRARWAALRSMPLRVAALLLLGSAATIGVAVLQRENVPSPPLASSPGERVFASEGAVLVASTVSNAIDAQEPQPRPKVQTPPATHQDPQPTPKPAPTPKSETPKTETPKTEAPKTEAPKTEAPKVGSPMPKGTDPADLAAIRSAEAMLEAERKLAKRLKAGEIRGVDQVLTFDKLTGWTYKNGLEGAPESVKGLSGRKVLMVGFMLPIDEVQGMKEFLLVQSLWSCCYGKPPDIHGIVRCVMPKGKTTDYLFDPLKVIGTFKVEVTMVEGFCVDIFQLEVESVEAIK
ncbi:MAG: DUF3299 domain-containing protein [Planctomycetota bacterium]